MAETCLRLAEIKAGLGQPATSELREGLPFSAEQTLNVAAGWPQVLAIQGALLVLSARRCGLCPSSGRRCNGPGGSEGGICRKSAAKESLRGGAQRSGDQLAELR